MPGTVLVTGGSGYAAGFLIRRLIDDGWTVHATVRSLGKEAAVRQALAVDNDRLHFFAADLGADAGWAEAVAGCTHVAHVASPIPIAQPKSDDELIIPARDGTLRVLRAARDAGVRRVVMTSSCAAITYGRGRTTRAYTEADWTDVNGPDVSGYNKSKTLAERAARDWIAAEGGGMEFAAICPTAIMGPVMSGDFAPSIEIIRRMLAGDMKAVPDLGFGVVDVRDLADLHVRALTLPGMANERFIASSRFYKFTEIAQMLKDELGDQAARVSTRVAPNFVVRLVGLFRPDFRPLLTELGNVRNVDASHAQAVLGWTPTPVQQTLGDCGRSLIELGLIK